MKKSVEMTPRRKRQSLYLGLFAMAAIYAFTNHDGVWLAIALAAALIVDEIMYVIEKRRHEKKGGETSELIETTGVDVKKTDGETLQSEARPSDPKDE